MKKYLVSLLVVFAVLACTSLLYSLTILKEQGQTIEKHEKLIEDLQAELEYQNNVDYALRNNYANVQAQLDRNELYMWQYGTGQLSVAEFAAKVENNPGRAGGLLEISKHQLPW